MAKRRAASPFAPVTSACDTTHRVAEEVLAASGLRWTPVRPLVLANNALNWSYSIRAEGVVRIPHPESVTAPIDERDIAGVVVAALTGRAGDGASDLLTGGSCCRSGARSS